MLLWDAWILVLELVGLDRCFFFQCCKSLTTNTKVSQKVPTQLNSILFVAGQLQLAITDSLFTSFDMHADMQLIRLYYEDYLGPLKEGSSFKLQASSAASARALPNRVESNGFGGEAPRFRSLELYGGGGAKKTCSLQLPPNLPFWPPCGASRRHAQRRPPARA
jgi:hypothetical protein